MLVIVRFQGFWAAFSMALVALLIGTWLNTANAAITWDSLTVVDDPDTPEVDPEPVGAGTQWWFDPVNWGPTNPGEALPWFLPPTVDGVALTDAQINEGTGTLPGGEGVVYDPVNDPHYADLDLGGSQTLGAENLTYPTGYGPKAVERIYISRNTTQHNVLTIKGDLEVKRSGTQAVIVGRSGSSTGNENLGRINQLRGHVLIQGDLDIASSETSGWGNGIYDYRGGKLEVGPSTVTEIRLSAAGGGAGAAGHGRLIVHNPGYSPGDPDSGGYIRTRALHVAAVGSEGTSRPADGVNYGVGIVEFHFENGGTRPVQIREELQLNNGSSVGNLSTRSSLLDLRLDAAPCTGTACVPIDLGLFDVDFGNSGFGIIVGGLSRGATFSNVSNPSQVYTEDSIVSAMFGGTRYDWKISYTGNINWDDAANSVLDVDIDDDGVQGPGTGTDVVLIGWGSVPVGLPGDYNNNHVVDAADYTVWRDHLGAADESSLNGNGDGMNGVDVGDYNRWKTHFGESSGAGSAALGAGAVPEPSAVMLSLLSLFGLVGVRRRAG